MKKEVLNGEEWEKFNKIFDYVQFQLHSMKGSVELANMFVGKTKKFKKAFDDDVKLLFKVSRILSNPKAELRGVEKLSNNTAL